MRRKNSPEENTFATTSDRDWRVLPRRYLRCRDAQPTRGQRGRFSISPTTCGGSACPSPLLGHLSKNPSQKGRAISPVRRWADISRVSDLAREWSIRHAKLQSLSRIPPFPRPPRRCCHPAPWCAGASYEKTATLYPHAGWGRSVHPSKYAAASNSERRPTHQAILHGPGPPDEGARRMIPVATLDAADYVAPEAPSRRDALSELKR